MQSDETATFLTATSSPPAVRPSADESLACEDAMLVSALTDEDAGTLNIGNIFTNGFDWDWVNAAFGGNVLNDESAADIRPVGTGANWGSRKCMARCGIDPYNTNTSSEATETSANRNATSSEVPRTRPRLPRSP